jgi:5-methylcytosine-specific restriction endonuclease McrA
MTKPVTRKLAVDCLLDRVIRQFGTPLLSPVDGEPLMPGEAIQFDHIHADVFGGPHEYRNLRPIHTGAHKKKTKADIQAVAKIDRITGITGNGPKRKIQSPGFDKTHTRKFDGSVVRR